MDEIYLQLLSAPTLRAMRAELHGYTIDLMADLKVELRDTTGQDRENFLHEIGRMVTTLTLIDKVITEKEG